MTGIPSWAVKGAKVVCVDAAARTDCRPEHREFLAKDAAKLREGEIYTIDAVVIAPSGEIGIVLVGIASDRPTRRRSRRGRRH